MQFSSNPGAERCGSPQVTAFRFERFALLGLVDAVVTPGTRTHSHFSFVFN